MDANNTYTSTLNASTSFAARMESQPTVETLRQGSCATAIQLHQRADQYARHHRPNANTTECSGQPGVFFPFLSTVLDEDTLTRTALHRPVLTTGEDGSRDVPRSPLKIQSSKAEQKVARAFRDAEPRNLDSDITEEARSVTPPRAATERSTFSSRKKASVADKKALAADLIEAIRIEVGTPVGTSQRTTERSPVRTPAYASRMGDTLQSQAGNKAVLDASAVHLMTNSMRSFHAQYETFFEQTLQHVSVEGQPRLWLQDLDTLVAVQIAEAINGQIALLHVVRASLASIAGDTAIELSRQLSQAQLDYTVAKYLRTRRPKGPDGQATEHLDIALRFVPFGRIALAMVTELMVTGSFGHDEALLAAARLATIKCSPGRIVIDVGDLISAMRHLGGAPVDPTDAMIVIEALIADNGRFEFTSPGEDDPDVDIDWKLFAVKTCTLQAARKRRGKRASLPDLRALVDSLTEFSMASARINDALATTLGLVSAPPHSAYQLTTASATVLQIDGIAPADDEVGDAIYYTLSTESLVPCFNCREPGSPRFLFCKSCGKFATEVWKCSQCQLPTSISSTKCHQWTCPGLKGATRTSAGVELTAWETNFQTRLDGERAKNKADRAGGGGKGGTGGMGGRGGKGGVGGKGGRGAADK